MSNANFDLKGDKELLKALRNLEKQAKPVVRSAVRSASAPIRKAIKAAAPVRFGHLRKSIIAKTKSYSSGTSLAIIGPSADYTATDDKGNKIKPSKYSHLVEFGTDHSAAQPFIRPGFEGGKDAAMSVLKERLWQGIEKTASKR